MSAITSSFSFYTPPNSNTPSSPNGEQSTSEIGLAYLLGTSEEKETDLDLSCMEIREMRYRESVQGLAQLEIGKKSLVEYGEDGIKALKVRDELKDFLILLCDTSLSIEDYRTCIYSRVLDELRSLTENILLDTSSNLLEKQIIKNLCYLHFTLDIRSSEIGLSYVRSLFDSDGFSDKLLDPYELDKRLSAVFKNRSTAIEVTDLSRRTSANLSPKFWDPASYSIRSHFSTLALDGRPIHFLRTACPVLGPAGTPEIDPLFKGYLLSLEVDDCHLYVNNLSHNQESDVRRGRFVNPPPIALEFQRSEKLKDLSLDLNYSKKFKLITLPYDSDFYRQKGVSDSMKANDFIDEFVRNVEGNLQGFYFPNTLNKEYLALHVRKQLNEILNEVFEAKGELSIEERKIMIHIAYADITKSFLKKWKITHCNITCKDGVDRAMGSLANLQVRLDPKTSIEQILYTLTIAATLNHARGPKFSRLIRSLASINIIRELAER